MCVQKSLASNGTLADSISASEAIISKREFGQNFIHGIMHNETYIVNVWLIHYFSLVFLLKNQSEVQTEMVCLVTGSSLERHIQTKCVP